MLSLKSSKAVSINSARHFHSSISISRARGESARVGGRAQVELLEAVACLPRELVSVRGTRAAVDAARYVQVPRFVHRGSEAALLAGDRSWTSTRPRRCGRSHALARAVLVPVYEA